ncbi:MAG: phage integrase SAM-like domain-containing protein, partial [Lewinella sp.]|nr:phage integrase SAM-like domain-containing protein [Lewinella sp.]
MKLRNILWTYEPHKDGACHIRIYVYYQGRKKYFPTGISVQPEFWSEKTEEVKRTHPMAKRYNAVIRTKRMEIERHFLDGGSWSGLTNKNRFGGDVIAFGRQIIAEAEAGQLPLKESTLKSYRATVKRLAAFANGAIPFESIDMDFYSQFTDYLGKNGCGLPGIGKHIKTLKRIMNLGMERNIHDNRAHKESAFRVHRTGKRAKVYLTE